MWLVRIAAPVLALAMASCDEERHSRQLSGTERVFFEWKAEIVLTGSVAAGIAPPCLR